jgi:methionyl-tRNA formyltransferase
MPQQRVVLLTGDEDTGFVTAGYLATRFSDLTVIVEEPESRVTFLRRRLRRLGVVTVAGQIGFMIFQRFQQKLVRARIEAILNEGGLKRNPPDSIAIEHVSSVNAPECLAILKRIDPAVVLVMGTRIIDPGTLRAIAAPIINFHAGITPKYRGVHGGYWALAESDGENFGSTVHLVDEGIDSGAILFQARIKPTKADNFSTYPYLQLRAGLPLLSQAAEAALAGRLVQQKSDMPSRLWSHPTIWTYLSNRIMRGIR